MPSSLRRLAPVFILIVLSAAACGGPAIEGIYANAAGDTKLELKAGEQASFTVLGDTQACTYKRESAKLTVACPGQQTFDFTVGSDGTLTSQGTLGTLKKAAS